MATLTRRLQVLLDEQCFAHLERLADERDTTVAALVREALDRSYPRDGLSAEEAAERFLDRAPVDLGAWEDIKPEVEEGMRRSAPM